MNQDITIPFINDNPDTLDLFYRLGVATPEPLFIGSRKSQEFRTCVEQFPDNVFNPEALGIQLIGQQDNNTFFLTTDEFISKMNSAFIAGVIESRTPVICKAFLGTYGFLKRESPWTNTERVGGTLGEIGMLLRRGYKIKCIFEENPDARDIETLITITKKIPTNLRGVYGTLMNSPIIKTRILFQPPEFLKPVVAREERLFMKERDLYEILRDEGIKDICIAQWKDLNGPISG